MSPRTDRDERVERLTKNANERSEATRAAAQRAILALSNRGLPVTVQAIAAEAGVSESYLTKNSDLRNQIRALARDGSRTRQAKQLSPAALAAHQTKLQVVVGRVREPERENQQLRVENATLRGEVLELRRSTRRRH